MPNCGGCNQKDWDDIHGDAEYDDEDADVSLESFMFCFWRNIKVSWERLGEANEHENTKKNCSSEWATEKATY